MRYIRLAVLFSSLQFLLPAESVPAGWKLVKDSKGVCQIIVPEDWTPSENAGSAVYKDSSVGIAVVTSQPGQTFKPLTESLQKLLAVRKEKMFENTTKRIFYQDKISRGPEDANAYSVSVPGYGGTCSSRIVFLPSIPAETARKIVLSIGPATIAKEPKSP